MKNAKPGSSKVARATILVPLAGLVFVVLYGVFGVGRDTSPRLHSLRNPAACSECHSEDEPGKPRTPEPGLCRRCHEDVSPHCEPNRAPGGRRCSGCHDPHGKVGGPFLLRNPR